MADNNGKTDVENPPAYAERTGVNPSGDVLPSYTQAMHPGGSEAPPSYESLYGRVKAARDESSGTFTFLKAFVVIILSTIGVTIFIGILMAVPISMIVMGAIHLDDCKAERMIPIYLLVAGCFGVARNVFSLVQRMRKDRSEVEEDQKKVNPIESLVNCFLFAWFIAGCVFIYRTKDDFQSSDPNADDYCDKTLYWYAFWITTAVYIIMAASCCCVCCVGCLSACFMRKK